MHATSFVSAQTPNIIINIIINNNSQRRESLAGTLLWWNRSISGKLKERSRWS